MAERVDPARDLLSALLALRHGLIGTDALAAAFDAWTSTPSLPMSAALAGPGGLDPDALARLDRLVAAHPAATDPAEATATVGWIPPPSTTTAAGSGSGSGAGTDAGSSPSEAGPGPRFRVLGLHARGGLGEVSHALDTELNRRVALKRLQEFHADHPVSRARFLREAQVTGRLEHPGVVPVYGLGHGPDGRPYYATRFVEGETLQAAVRRFHSGRRRRGATPDDPERALAFRRLLRAVIDACNTVAYAHEKAVIHRDLKPDNILLGRFGETFVVDWGVARPLDAPPLDDDPASAPDAEPDPDDSGLTRPGAAVGTPAYMSPEQAAGDTDRVGPASDVYSLGATLYAVLTGRAPFGDAARGQGGVAGLLAQVAAGLFPTPREVDPTVDPALEAVCLKAMARDPGSRHASPLGLADELERWLADVRYRAEQTRALNQARKTLARLCVERAHGLFARERHGEGMLWLARALAGTPDDDPALARAVRAGLAAWHGGSGRASCERSFGHAGAVVALAFAPDGRRLAAACAGGVARVWDAATGSALTPPMTHAGPAHALAFRPDGLALATADGAGRVTLWDARNGKPLAASDSAAGPVVALAFHPTGAWVAAAGPAGSPCLRDGLTAAPARDLEPRPPDASAALHALAFSPDGATLAAADDAGRVWLWDAAPRRWRPDPLAHPAAVTALAFRPDGRHLVTGAADGLARVWDVSDPSQACPRLAEPEHGAGAVGALAFSPDGATLATAGDDGQTRLWHAGTAAPRGEPLPHRARVHALTFGPTTPDGLLWLATASWDGTARLWDVATGLPVGPPLPHKDQSTVYCLAFSPDGQRLATGGADGFARAWRVPAPVPGPPERVDAWVRLATGLDFDPGDAVRPLDPLSLLELRRRLATLGGPCLK